MAGETGNIQTAAAESLKAPWGEMAAPVAPNADEKLWGMLANVLGLVFLIGPIVALLLKGSSKFVKFYAIQMLCWNIVGLGLGIVLGAVLRILWTVPFIGMLVVNILSPLISLVFLVLLVLLAVKANNGVIYKLPVVGEFSFKKAYES